MLFSALYEFAESGGAKSAHAPVSVTKLAGFIRESRHDHIEQIKFWPVPLDASKILGYMKQTKEQSSPYDDHWKVIDVRYADSLNFCWRRFVCCKELMHVFDTGGEKTSTRERFFQLMEQLESPPMVEDFSKMLSAEYSAEWMALMVLCPLPLREEIKRRIDAKELTELEAATEIRIPRLLIRAVLSEYFLEAFQERLR
jgi:hypothetical protein